MRASGVRDVLIYWDVRCSHHVEVNADGWPDDVRLSDIEPKFTCTSAANMAPMSGRTFTGEDGHRLMAWFKRFYDPIILPDGRKLLTLGEAAEYITGLPKAEKSAAAWHGKRCCWLPNAMHR